MATSLELIRSQGAMLPTTAREKFEAEQLAVLWDMHAKGCSLAEFAVLLNLAEKYDLDINAHEIWAAKGRARNGEPGKLMILVGRDGLLTIARRQTDFVTVDGDVHRKNDTFKVTRLPDGTWTVEHSYEGGIEARGEIVGAWAMVKRRDGSFTNYTYTPIGEYKPSYPGWEKSPWGKQESAMIQKCAVSLCLRIAYGIAGVVGEEEVSGQFGGGHEQSTESLAAVAEEIPEGLRDRFYAAYGDAATLRPGEVNAAMVTMSVRGQSAERVEQFIEALELANEEARRRLADAGEEVADADVVPDGDGEGDEDGAPPAPAGDRIASLRAQLADIERQVMDLEESPGDFAETSLEMDRLAVEEERVRAELAAAENADQGSLL